MPTKTGTALSLLQLLDREDRVFPSYPQVARYFPAKSIEDARNRIGNAIERGTGPCLIIGGPGTGKSLLLQVLAAKYHEQFDIVLPACARLCTRRALLQSILFELGLPYRSRDEGELRLSLTEHLLSKEDCPAGLLLLVDEAQTLSVALLDELRVLTNLVRGAKPRVRLVLAGSSVLEEYFADPELESFSQRLAARCYLGPMSREETSQFIGAQLAACGVTPEHVFTTDSCAAVFEATDGVPRLVNQLCDRALAVASAQGAGQVDREVIQAAWADLQQLPAPWDTPHPVTEEPVSEVVEFGDLDSTVENRTPTLRDEADARSSVAILRAKFTEDDTELDVDDDEVVECISQTSVVAPARFQDESGSTADPFAESFAEEEVVLDTFAAWDEMFRQNAPRVANRRDPGFATLVSAALEASDEESVSCRTQDAADLSFEFDLQTIIDSIRDIEAIDDKKIAVARNGRPSLKIADVSEATSPAPAAPELEKDTVLIVEDDAPTPSPVKPAVRREEYRNLFSRLRSG